MIARSSAQEASAPVQVGFAPNAEMLEAMYDRWKTDPASVDRDWQCFFAGFDLGYLRPMPGDGDHSAPANAPANEAVLRAGRGDQQKVDSLIAAYRALGHTICHLDPLDLNNTPTNPYLELAAFGLSDDDLDREYASDSIAGFPDRTRLRDIISYLRRTYCGTIGVEYQHIQDRAIRLWLREHIEAHANQPRLSRDEKRRILMKVNQAETLETFVHTKFLGQKRFSLEGGEALIPALDAITEACPALGLKELVIGMAHRGRLNVLCNIMGKSYEELFTEFEGSYDINQLQGDGDVKYHLGYSTDQITATGDNVHLTLSHNPSHLEAVNPVVLGRVRAKQRQYQDTAKRGVVAAILMHGDAALAGQGLVLETLQMAGLEGYTTGGTIHIVSNNQIGFTTLPADSRSTRHCTDIAKTFDAPVFHVNGDDVEGVVHVCKLAALYRQTFKKDVFVDIVCYRRYGHNESDEPNYTQPTMYAKIAEHPRLSKVYTQQLLAAGEIQPAEAEAIATIMNNQLQDALNSVKVRPAKLTRKRFEGLWSGMTNQYRHEAIETGVEDAQLQLIGKALSTWPEGFRIHPKIKRMAEERGRAISSRGRIEWALAEMMAIGSLLVEPTPVRLSGQDCRRGTFSQRHSYWYDTETRERWKPLNHITAEQANFCVYNSPLSEAGVLGFDYGYSLAEPNMLIIWEAQFGDFVNGAQVIIDQFLASSESKWGRASGLVMMLPHGQEGAGPEHSSARPERFLQSCAEDNMQVAYCSTAAQHFHILRRQMRRSVRKPLILMTPKSHLRSKQASSDFAEFTGGRFHEILADPQFADPALKAKRVVLCTGKVAHDLMDRRTEEKITDVAIVRIEQLYPLHDEMLKTVLARFPKAELWWCQEEPQNMGAWSFIDPLLRQLTGSAIHYAGREAAASPAPGSMALFQLEQEQLVTTALGIQARALSKKH